VPGARCRPAISAIGSPPTGYKKTTDLRASVLSAASLGIWVPPWERRVSYPDYTGRGWRAVHVHLAERDGGFHLIGIDRR
jgi:hypothetical protein